MIQQVAKRSLNIRFDRGIENKNFGQGVSVISQRRFDLKDYTKTILLFIAQVAFGVAVFFVCAEYSISENSQNTIRATVTRQSEHLHSILELHYQYLQIIADQIGETDDIISDENMKMIANLHEYTDLELSAIIEQDGTSHYDNGTEKNVAYRSYFQEAMEGKQALSDRWKAVLTRRHGLCSVFRSDGMKWWLVYLVHHTMSLL